MNVEDSRPRIVSAAGAEQHISASAPEATWKGVASVRILRPELVTDRRVEVVLAIFAAIAIGAFALLAHAIWTDGRHAEAETPKVPVQRPCGEVRP
jgi:hypothetical protein